ncbi:hypothetical protein [Alkalibacterium kapii]|uniref:Uncharacterized protein n=1 Tax=Alkalibacterium kapii TaxID=426704 RepID=A0A511AUZ3_9LACT|nr:hypothetical protein [Alkalibacterium kapii]GEK91502.1 hypothetical protein AKA01nite_11240 [Alkalibacterium kapii]
MLTDEQIKELKQLLKESKENNMSPGIAQVTNLIYPVDSQTKQSKLKTK